MNNEFKRMQRLAGIKEMVVNNPVLVKFEDLKIGDKLIVRHIDPNDNWKITYKVGEVWKITDIIEGWMLATGHMLYKMEQVNGDKESHYLYDTQMKKAVDSNVFDYYRKPKTNEMKVNNPTQLNINDLKIGDKLLIKHTDPFVAFVFRVGQVWEIANIDEEYEHYRLVNTNTQTSLGFSERDLSEMIENGVFEYAKKTNVDEIKVKNPIVLFLTEEVIDLDKDFFRYFEGLWEDEKYELINDYEENLKEILNLPDVSDLMMSYDNMREYLNTQTPEALNKIKEYLKNKLKELGVKINEMKINAPIFTLPEGWKELDKNEFPSWIRSLRPEMREGAEIINGWIPTNTKALDGVLLIKINDQYYVEGWKDDENWVQEGPFSTMEIAEKEILKSMDFIMDYWHVLQEMKINDPLFTIPEGWYEDEDIEQDPELWGGTIVRSWWAPMNGDDEEHADRIFLVKSDDQYYVHYVYAFSYNDVDGPFLNESKALSKILEAMKETMSYWNENDELINEIQRKLNEITSEMKVKDPTTPPIEEFGDENIDEIKELVGYDGTKVLKTFEKTKGDKAAYAVFNVVINGTNYKTIIIISYDPNFIPAHLVKTTKINNRTIYYVEV